MKTDNTPIAQKFHNLSVVLIHATGYNEHPFNNFTHLTNLQHLEVFGQSILNEKSMPLIANFKNLRVLKFEYVEVLSDASMKILSQMTSLRSLQVSVMYENKAPTDEGVKHLGNLHQLEALALENLQSVTNEGISFLSNLTALHTFKVDLKNVKGDFLKGCDSLKYLEIRFMPIEPSFNLPPTLSHLTIVHPPPLPDTFMKQLLALEHLTHLSAIKAIEIDYADLYATLKKNKPHLVTKSFVENI
jgi:hypothetical protein